MVLRNDAVCSLKHGQVSYYECQLSLHSTGDVSAQVTLTLDQTLFNK